ncbi:hypothetical protein ACE6H2_015869 [Prunus campanulata]
MVLDVWRRQQLGHLLRHPPFSLGILRNFQAWGQLAWCTVPILLETIGCTNFQHV